MNAEQTDSQVNERDEQFAQLIAKCWADEAFKAKLLANTMETLKNEGLEPPEGITIQAVADNDKLFHMIIPSKPIELSDEALDEIVGGRGGVGAFGQLANEIHDKHTNPNYSAAPYGWRHPTEEEKRNSPRAKMERWLQAKVWNRF